MSQLKRVSGLYVRSCFTINCSYAVRIFLCLHYCGAINMCTIFRDWGVLENIGTQYLRNTVDLTLGIFFIGRHPGLRPTQHPGLRPTQHPGLRPTLRSSPQYYVSKYWVPMLYTIPGSWFSYFRLTELDASAFGHLHTLITKEWPGADFASVVKRYHNLDLYTKRIWYMFFLIIVSFHFTDLAIIWC